MRPQEDMTEQEVRADPDPVQLPRPPRPAPRPPLPWNPREPGVAVGLAGREAAELTPLGIKNLNSFLYFFRVEESRGRKYFTGRRLFFFFKKERICTWTVGKREREWRMGWEI